MMAPFHKAVPEGGEHGVSTCASCGENVKRVPGGQGTTWVHTNTGMVVGGSDRQES